MSPAMGKAARKGCKTILVKEAKILRRRECKTPLGACSRKACCLERDTGIPLLVGGFLGRDNPSVHRELA